MIAAPRAEGPFPMDIEPIDAPSAFRTAARGLAANGIGRPVVARCPLGA